MRLLLFLILWQLSFVAYSQLTGKVTLEQIGVEFTIPEDWAGQQTETGYILGTQREAGAIFLSSHQNATLDALRQEAMAGIYDDGGTQLRLESSPEHISENSLGGTYTGTFQGTPGKSGRGNQPIWLWRDDPCRNNTGGVHATA